MTIPPDNTPGKPEGAKGPSWILELRQRLMDPPPRPPMTSNGHTDTERLAYLVSIFVESNQLWTYVVEMPELQGTGMCPVTFPSQLSEPGKDPWIAIARCAEDELGIQPERVLRIGTLDSILLSESEQAIPCVAAVPTHGGEGAAQEQPGLLGLPLVAFANPKLVEEMTISEGGRELTIPVFHVGNRRYWGPVAQVLQNLLQRLGIG